jgi:cob(I)alamin adenosyltransferase
MRSLSSSFACREHRTAKPFVVTGGSSDADLVRWARAVIRDPQRYGADQRIGAIVADLLRRFEASR